MWSGPITEPLPPPTIPKRYINREIGYIINKLLETCLRESLT